jgi:hypothetical protein
MIISPQTLAAELFRLSILAPLAGEDALLEALAVECATRRLSDGSTPSHAEARARSTCLAWTLRRLADRLPLATSTATAGEVSDGE